MKRVKPHGRKPRPEPVRRPVPNGRDPGRTALVQIEKPIYGGAFLSRIEGKAVFVPLTLPGEDVRVRVIEDKRSYAAAEPEEIITPAPSRTAPLCPHFGKCGGCNYQHADYATQLDWKQQILREAFERAGVRCLEKIEVLAGNPWHYRNRIRLAFDAAGLVGYRSRRSHELVPITECPIAAAILVKGALDSAEIVRSIRPSFRPAEVSLFCDASERALLASVSTRGNAGGSFDQFANAWHEVLPELAGVELVSERNADSNSRALAQWGEEAIAYRVADFDYRVENGAFFQVNRWILDELVRRVVGNRKGELAWDLFAGVGLFARQLCGSFQHVVAVESSPSAKESLAQNLQGSNGTCVTTDTLSFLKRSASTRPDLIVVDPPRAGLGAETTAVLAQIASPDLVYVSCDPATLARDLKALISSGYSIVTVTLVDLFPQTFHLETLVELRRS